jgi:hypothetical protein
MEDDLARSPSLGRSMRERRKGPSDSEADEEAEECDESGDRLDLGCEIEIVCGRGDVICERVVPTMFSIVAARDLVNGLDVNVQLYLHGTGCYDCFKAETVCPRAEVKLEE